MSAFPKRIKLKYFDIEFKRSIEIKKRWYQIKMRKEPTGLSCSQSWESTMKHNFLLLSIITEVIDLKKNSLRKAIDRKPLSGDFGSWRKRRIFGTLFRIRASQHSWFQHRAIKILNFSMSDITSESLERFSLAFCFLVEGIARNQDSSQLIYKRNK